MKLPQNRQMFEATEPERIAYEIAQGAWSAVRAMESQAMFGIDIDEAKAQANQTRTTQDPVDVDDALSFLKSRADRRSGTYSPASAGLEASAEPDTQGEQQIGYDRDAWDASVVAANEAGLVALGEEDEYRAAGAAGAKLRGKRLASLIANGLPFAIVDPLDGSNQAAGMSQRSGWAACAMVKWPGMPGFAVAVLLGDGRGFIAGGGQVWLSEASHPDRTPLFYALDVDRTRRGMKREHYVVPAAKRSTLERAYAIMNSDQSIEYISPLGGNPGILAAMYGGSAPAAMQPAAFAWDHMAALVLANGGFPVLRASDSTPLDAEELAELLLTDMVAGKQTETLYMGRKIEFAARLRDADQRSKVLS